MTKLHMRILQYICITEFVQLVICFLTLLYINSSIDSIHIQLWLVIHLIYKVLLYPVYYYFAVHLKCTIGICLTRFISVLISYTCQERHKIYISADYTIFVIIVNNIDSCILIGISCMIMYIVGATLYILLFDYPVVLETTNKNVAPTTDHELTCTVCLSNVDMINFTGQIVKLRCGHVFHGPCILNWIRTSNKANFQFS